MFEFQFSKVATLRNDLLSGLTVALALVPEAVAFAFVAGVDPLVGLYAAFMVGLITACIGGRPGMISGATGALAVVMVSLVADHGVEYLFITVVLMGLLQITAGVLKLGKFIRMVPYPVMLGFVNGLAIVIFLAQLGQFGEAGQPGWLDGTFMQGSIVDVAWLEGQELYMLLSLVLVTMIIIHSLPRFTKSLPSSLVAILVVTGLVLWLDIDTKVVGDVASISGGLPSFHIPVVPFSLETLWIILPYAIILAAIGLIESLLTLRLIDEITETRGRGNRECIGQGVANTVTGFFGGMGGCAMIGQSMINVNSGGRGRMSGISAALFLLLFILVASPLIEQIPLAALIGVMFIVVIGTFEWSSFRIVGKVPRSDALILVTVSAVTVATDLAVAVVVGVIISALVFAWEHAKHIRIDAREDHKGSTVYAVTGPLFFGSVTSFLERFDPAQDNDDVVIDFARSRVADHSGLEAIDTLAERYENAGKTLHLVHLSEECRKLLKKAGNLVEVNVIEDPKYFVAEDSLA
ncbi:SulP family inorganic anion transporter [Porticoccaceae bacterium]|jgi:SulP family sulfate permease|nr:SulP family inorganic anion transporter [Porticoccaceae bacterium]MDA8978480.1 SulP family inorganic anion transporter [bacterium]MBT6320383.1 SulP family inorganic anion transporter [Porticoccaceae bacterium]MBT7259078.1 SulP family inorganic anion transporter [Porticoccaceae bacterium]MDA7767257.1 SulP family inorganic anion transporter [Porticoccaceae bacterium]